MRYYTSVAAAILAAACTLIGGYCRLIATPFVFIPRAWAAGAIIFLLFGLYLNTLPQEDDGILRDVFKPARHREREHVGV